MDGTPAEVFEWLHDEAVVMWCLTFVEAVGADDVLAAFGAEPLGEPASWATLPVNASERGSGVRVAPLGRWSLAIELESILGSGERVLRGLSRGGRALNLLRTGSGLELVQYWVRGELVCGFEPGMEESRGGAAPDALLGDMAAVGMVSGSGREAEAPVEAPFLLARRLTGITADRALVLGSAWPAGIAG
ncbi:DUF6461 domain-containing protein [Actinosynnema sp. NPDC059797]